MKKSLLTCAVFALLLGAACNDLNDLKDDVRNLQNRVEAIETQVSALNNNVEALQHLLNGAVVSEVSLKEGVYTVTLSNGEILTLTQGSEGGYITPLLGVDADGYWTVSTDGGKNYTQVKGSDKQPVKAVATDGDQGDPGKDGVTPKFKVDDAGYWLVSYDEGKTYARVTDASGNPVSATGATGTTDKFFADITYADDLLTVALLDGMTLKVPVLGSFKCVIASTEEVEKFAFKQTREFAVTLVGVATTVVTAPEGWTAVLSESVLKVTAPAEVTRAVADTSLDVAIVAVSDNGYSCISKIRVALNGAVLHTPVATVLATDQTTTSLTFTVGTEDSNAWKYICQLASQTAPTAETIATTGTAGETSPLVIDNLTDNTAYTLYVLPLYDETQGEVAQASATTVQAVVDYYTAGCTLGGVTYNKDTAGAQLLTGGETIDKAGVYFLDPTSDAATFSLAKLAASDVVIIGRYSNVRPALTISGIQSLNGASGVGYLFKNVDITCATANYVFNFGSTAGVYDNFLIEDCRLTTELNKAFSYFNVANSAIKSAQVINSTIKINISANEQAVRFLVYNNTKAADVQRITFQNSVIYAPYINKSTLVLMPATLTPDLEVTLTQCSLINILGQPNGLINISGDKALTIRDNVFWATDGYALPSYLLKYTGVTTAPAMTIENNVVYGLASDLSWLYFHTGSSYLNDSAFTREHNDPFEGGTFSLATGKFVTGGSFSAYGAKL